MTKEGYPSRGRSRSTARDAKARAKKVAAESAAAKAPGPEESDIPFVLARYLSLEEADEGARDLVLAQTERRGVTRKEVAAAIVADLTEVKRLMDTDPDLFSDLRMGFSQRQKHLELLARTVEDGGESGPGLNIAVMWPRLPRVRSDVGDRPKTDEHDPGLPGPTPSETSTTN